MDILFSIFDNLHDDEVEFKTLQSARLVCSIFNRLASPLLCPILEVQLDQTSLDLADKISRSPLIAAGVRSIHVVLHYRPRELAEDPIRYKNQRKKDIGEMIRSCDYFAETWFLGGYDDDDETVCEQPLRVYNKAMDDYWAMTSAWDGCFLQPDVAAMDEDTLRYREILRRGYEEYRRKHEEQFRLVMDRTFVETLASAISRMGNCTSLRIVVETSGVSFLNPYSSDPTRMSTNPEELPRLMVNPFDWRTIEELEGGAELLPAKIHSELPIAIQKTGAAMPAINLDCFPTTNNYSMIRPDRPGRSPAWPDLRSACQHLTEFGVNGNCQPIRCRHLLPEEQAPIYEYFSAILSGQNIEVVDLDFYVFKLNDGGKAEAQGLYRIGAILATVNWPRIKELRISHVSLLQGELEAFCRGLDGGRINVVYFYDVEVLGRSWAEALDILRERVASRCLDGKCKVYFSDFTGGEFGKKKKKRRGWSRFTESSEESDEEEKLIVAQAQSYVSGVGLQNPLRG
ncbi:hypothetical protein V502_08759 [Pseudogymnoascus sp. VKM F-4520 (FW-2644)]|nr:hypothetical protein V502_08759 [Pseudogymnoascus sp. VKM F-4520 (FW-2644)]